jgi:hypothetical protein
MMSDFKSSFAVFRDGVDKAVTIDLHRYDKPQSKLTRLCIEVIALSLRIDHGTQIEVGGHLASEIADRSSASAQARVPSLSSFKSRRQPDEQLLREAVLLSFCDPLPQQISYLHGLTATTWRSLLRWMDFSGLALYFLDRIVALEMCDLVPSSVLARLQQNLEDNKERTRGMIFESVAIQRGFQEMDLSYAVLKGLSFWPNSVPSPELRLQFDLDFLVAKQSATEARRVLERMGYRLYGESGRSWEFKRNERPGITLKDLYKAQPSHAVELHIENPTATHQSLLERVERREMHGINMPVLSSVDLFLGQGLHVYKHVNGEFSRAAHLLEFRRHAVARRNDKAFWSRLKTIGSEEPRASLGLGVTISLIEQTMGDFVPEDFRNWTVERLPRSARLWVEMYGRRVALGSFPGNKLYLLLQHELESAGMPGKRPLRKTLLPTRLPPPVIRAHPNETMTVRLCRYHMQIIFVLLRLRFHIVEGLRYARELHRWQRCVKQVAR